MSITALPPMFTVSLSRSGRAPLLFNGALLASAGKPPDDPKIVRWHELQLYRAASGRYVLAIVFQTTSRYEKPFADAYICSTPRDVVAELESHDPVDYVIGWPVPRYADKDARVREILAAEFELLVSGLLAQVGEEFAERV